MKYVKTNDGAREAIAQLKGALLTLAQPLVEVVIPAFTMFATILSRIITAVAQFVSGLFGKTLSQSRDGAKAMYKEANAIDAVGEAAVEATGSLAGFDEINTINTKRADEIGKGGSEIAPDFDYKSSISGKIASLLELLTGTALLVIGAILTFTGAHIFLGIGLMAIGAAMMYKTAEDNPGLIADLVTGNLRYVFEAIRLLIAVIGIVLLVTGHIAPGLGLLIAGILLFQSAKEFGDDNGKTLQEKIVTVLAKTVQIVGAFIAAIGLVLLVTGHFLSGLALLVAGVALFLAGKEAQDDNGKTLQEKITTVLAKIAQIVGAVIAVVGLLLLVTGHFLPGLVLLVAGVTLFLAGKEAQDDNGKTLQQKIVTVLREVAETVGPVIAVVGLVLLVTGHFLSGLALLVVGIALFEYSKASDDNGMTLQEKIMSVMRKTAEVVGAVIAVVGLILLVTGHFLSGLALLVAGVTLLNYGTADDDGGKTLWEKIEDALKYVWNNVKQWWNEHVAQYFTWEYWRDLGADMMEAFYEGLKSLIPFLTDWGNVVQRTVDRITGGVGKGMASVGVGSSSLPSLASIPSIASYDIPALAQGAVIPANREFLAVLGDQRSGTNIEAPADLIRQIMEDTMQKYGGGSADIHITVELDGRVVARNTVHHINDMTRQAGKPVLLY